MNYNDGGYNFWQKLVISIGIIKDTTITITVIIKDINITATNALKIQLLQQLQW